MQWGSEMKRSTEERSKENGKIERGNLSSTHCAVSTRCLCVAQIQQRFELLESRSSVVSVVNVLYGSELPTNKTRPSSAAEQHCWEQGCASVTSPFTILVRSLEVSIHQVVELPWWMPTFPHHQFLHRPIGAIVSI